MNKKIISLLLVGSMSISMVGCKGHFRFDKFSKKDKNEKIETNIENNNNNQFNWGDNNTQTNSKVSEAYEYYKSEFTKYEDTEKKYEYDTTGIGFTQYITDERIISKGNEQGMADFLALEYKEATNNKKVMDSNGFTTVDYFYKISYNGKIIVEVRNGNLITFDTGDEEFKNNELAMLSQGDERTTSDKGNNTLNNNNSTKNTTNNDKTYTCKECGKKYKKKNSDANEPTKYCSSECYTESRMKQRNKDAKTTKTYYCKDCGTKISKSQYNSWKRCSSCARTHDKEQKKEYTCKYCGKGYTSDEAKANNAPEGFCSEICAVNWEGQQHENWEAHHGYDSNGRLIPCKDRCGDGCE